jgi:L-iditol 2-dehydrogenase
MKAAVVHGAGVLRVSEVPMPVPGPYDALCEITHGATCTGTDQHIIHGRFPFFPIPMPTVLGHESVGRVVETGAKVRNFRAGDLVSRVGTPPAADGSLNAHWGGFAEYGIARDHWAMCRDGVPRPEWNAHRVNQIVPPGVEPREATMIITWRETLSFLRRAGFRAGMRLLVLGSGGNGLAYAAHATRIGAHTVLMTGSPGRAGHAAAVGAEALFDYRDDRLADRIRERCPDGFDLVIDAVGREGALSQVLPLVRPEGTVCVYGIDDLDAVAVRLRAARGPVRVFVGPYDEEETHHEVVSEILRGRLAADPWFGAQDAFPLERINDAFECVEARREVKALVTMGQGRGAAVI